MEERKHVHKQGSFTAVLSLIESFTVVLSLICFWVVAWLTCIPNVVAQRIHGKLFSTMSKHNLVCWNARILGSVKYGQGKKALENAGRREGCSPPLFTFCGSFSMYVHDSRLRGWCLLLQG